VTFFWRSKRKLRLPQAYPLAVKAKIIEKPTTKTSLRAEIHNARREGEKRFYKEQNPACEKLNLTSPLPGRAAVKRWLQAKRCRVTRG